MIAFCLHFFGGTYDYWLDAPIRAVFSLYREGCKMEARHYAEMSWIAQTPRMNFDWFNSRLERYDRIVFPDAAQLPKKPGGPVLLAGSGEAQVCLRSVAVNLRRFMGYGGR